MGVALALIATDARAVASCEADCFEQARSCSDNTDFVLLGGSGCKDEQAACRMSCNSGRKVNDYRDMGSFSYSFRPMWEHLVKS